MVIFHYYLDCSEPARQCSTNRPDWPTAREGNQDVWFPSDAIYSAAHSRLMAQSTKYRMLLLMRSVRGEEGETGIQRKTKHRWRARRKRERESSNRSGSGEKSRSGYCVGENGIICLVIMTSLQQRTR